MMPQKDGFTMPAEWYPHDRCWMAWPCHKSTWEKIGLEKARLAFAKVAQAIAVYEPVTMLVKAEQMQGASDLCGEQIDLLEISLNDSWTRDTGPTFLINKQGDLAGIDWIHNAWGGNYKNCELDNQIAKKIIYQTQAKYYHAPLVMEGGSFHVDGEGTILTTRECLLNKNRNPNLTEHQIEDALKHHLNADKVIWLNQGLLGDETDGHVDEIACFIAPGKVLALITSDKNDENHAILQENLSLLKSATDAKGRSFEIYTVEQPPATYLNGERLTLSYINFYMANKGIVMPEFGYPEQDKAAYELMKALFPSYQITTIKALDIFAGGGGIHCITQQQPKKL